jgi:hypothetical protein
LLAELEVDEGLGAGDARDGPDPAQDLQQVVIVLADHLRQQVEGPGGDDDVVDLLQAGQLDGDLLQALIAIMAWRRKPSVSGSVTATICITPASCSRCTRCRTAASDSPTALPIAA